MSPSTLDPRPSTLDPRPSTLDTSTKSRTPYRDGSESFNATSPLVGNNRLRHQYSKIATLKVALSIKSYPGPRGFPWNFFRQREREPRTVEEREREKTSGYLGLESHSHADDCCQTRQIAFLAAIHSSIKCLFDNIKDLSPAWQNITRNHRIHGQKKIFKLFRSRKHFGVN